MSFQLQPSLLSYWRVTEWLLSQGSGTGQCWGGTGQCWGGKGCAENICSIMHACMLTVYHHILAHTLSSSQICWHLLSSGTWTRFSSGRPFEKCTYISHAEWTHFYHFYNILMKPSGYCFHFDNLHTLVQSFFLNNYFEHFYYQISSPPTCELSKPEKDNETLNFFCQLHHSFYFYNQRG